MQPQATFQIKVAFRITGRLLSGTIRKGMTVDLTAAGIPKKFIIEVIDFALDRIPPTKYILLQAVGYSSLAVLRSAHGLLYNHECAQIPVVRKTRLQPD